MENIVKEFPDKNLRLKYSFIFAVILEIMFLVILAEVVAIAKQYSKHVKKTHPLLISVVTMPHPKKKKIVVPPKKRVVHIKKVKKVVIRKPVIKPVPVVKPVMPVIAVRQVQSASVPVIPYSAPVVKPLRSVRTKIPVSLLDKYFGEIKAKIVGNLIYPMYARKEGMEGYVNVLFKILRNGDLVFEKIEKNSQYGTLNRSAIKTIKISAPFMPFPKGISRRSLTFLIKVHFKLKRR